MDELSTKKYKRISSSRYSFCICCAFFLAIGIGTGMLIGYYAVCDNEEKTQRNDQNGKQSTNKSFYLLKDGDPAASDKLIKSINSNNIRTYLRDLTKDPHLAGTPADLKQAKDLEEFWRNVGMDEVYITPYDVLLSYPNTTDEDNMNQIQILNSADGLEYASPLYEKVLHPSENKSDVVPPFNAYSAPGIITSTEMIYVNYGRVEDYRYIEKNMTNINVSGKIVIARYGKIFRGDKVQQAALHGAIGIVLYSDPADYANGQTQDVYPHSIWLPPSGAQRGTVKKTDGDPLTPGYPAIDTAFRLAEDDPNTRLPTITVHPIGYGIAKNLFNQMTGTENIPDEWKGAMNITYRIGGPLKHLNWKVRMRISTANHRRTIHNVFGIIRGAIEPDRYVLVGNHRDAWVFGAIDPSSGTAVLKEVSRAMGQMVKSGIYFGKWRPRRTIIFCSWGAEEYGLIGSNEWVEHYVKNIQTRSVAYVNMDIAVSGNYSLSVAASPLLNNVIYESTKKIDSPDITQTYKSLYENWAHGYPDKEDSSSPSIHVAGSGSDFAPFVKLAGVPICDVTYTSRRSYPLYHSKYETFYIVDKLVDPGFKYHKTVGQVVVEVVRRLSEDLLVPLVVTDFSKKLEQLVNQLEHDYGQLLSTGKITTKSLRDMIGYFKETATFFEDEIQRLDKNDPYAIRKVNDQMTLLEKSFLDPQGLPGRPLDRHVLFAESSVNSYAGSSFPGLADSLFEIEKDPNQEERWAVVQKHFSVILYTIESAASTLRDVTQFMKSM